MWRRRLDGGEGRRRGPGGRGGEKAMRKGKEDERRSGGEVKRGEERWSGGDEEGRR